MDGLIELRISIIDFYYNVRIFREFLNYSLISTPLMADLKQFGGENIKTSKISLRFLNIKTSSILPTSVLLKLANILFYLFSKGIRTLCFTNNLSRSLEILSLVV